MFFTIGILLVPLLGKLEKKDLSISLKNLFNMLWNIEFFNKFHYLFFSKTYKFFEILLENTENTDTCENVNSIYYYSTPNIKLYYPEPFIASGTFLHFDIWFLHIAIYQYWLWFFFIFIIVFFVINFLVTLRWCNIRIRPQRETRGVSRSKCGDLITATVPVSWACSIIIHESTDSIEYYDGFGTTEMAVGIRAYQWGWEYYYPKDIDLNFRVSNSSSTYLGNSIYSDFGESESNPTNKYLRYFTNSNDSNATLLSTSNLLGGSMALNDYNSWEFNNFGLSKLSIKEAYKSITDSKIFEKNELDSNFYSFNKSDNYLLFSNTDLSSLDNFNSEWSLLSQSAIFENSAIFSNTNFLDQILPNPGTSESGKGLLGTNSYGEDVELTNEFSKLTNLNSKLKDSSSINHNLPTSLYLKSPLSSISSEEAVFYSSDNLISTYSHNLNYLLTSASSAEKLKKWPGYSQYASSYFNRYDSNVVLEDLYWDLSITDETRKDLLLLNLKNRDTCSEAFSKISYYGDFDKLEHFKNLSITNAPYSVEGNEFGENSFQVSTRDGFYNYSLLPKLGLSWFLNISNLSDSVDNSFSLYKNNHFVVTRSGLNVTVSSPKLSLPLSSKLSLNLFWSDSEKPISFYNFSNSIKSIQSLDLYTLYSVNTNLLIDFKVEIFKILDLSSLVDTAKSFKIFEKSNLKVSREVSYEGRSSSDFKAYSSLGVEVPLLNSNSPSVQKEVTKDYSGFLNADLYKKSNYIDLFSTYVRGKNNFFFEFPFFLSVENDMIRYSWFDWYSKSNVVVVRAMDLGAYNIYGSKQFNKSSGIESYSYDDLTLYDNYKVKYSNTKKVHLPFSPYIDYVSNFNNNFSTKIHLSLGDTKPLTLISLSLDLLNANPWSEKSYTTLNSNNQSPAKGYIRSSLGYSSTPYFVSRLLDSVAKREYLLENLSLAGSNCDNGQVVELVKSQNTGISDSVKESALFKSYLLGSSKFNNTKYTFENQKSQYKHMRKNISNMIRIHADKAVAMPIETRIQILTVSKDIIHSWSIPSAGIKIDCIPGFSSHKVTIFLLSGVYWGQCMEICGRFHHWMPIVVYFMKRDLFLLWCTHFTVPESDLKSKNSSNSLNGFESNTLVYKPTIWL